MPLEAMVIGAVVVAGVAAYAYRTHRPSRQYLLGRQPDEGLWGRLYYGEDLVIAKEALDAITSAFLLRADDAARLLPEDRLMDVYRAAYPGRDTPDALEFETLWKGMRRNLLASEAELHNLTHMTVLDVIGIWLEKRGRPSNERMQLTTSATADGQGGPRS